jgi:copper chaperone CopZ
MLPMRWVRRRRSTLVRATRYHEKRNTETNRQRPCLLIAANASSPAKTLRFAGYDWVAKSATHEGPGPNNWNENNVWVDQGGYLHLKLTKQGDRWYCAEVLTKDRLGFGRYQFWVVGRLDRLDPNVVLGSFNYPTPDVGPDGTNEIDIEFAQWGKPEAPIGNYTVWPAREGLRRASKRFSMELMNRDAAQAPPFRSERETRGYPAGRATVQFDPSEITPEKLVEAVNSTGYKASLLRSGGS